MKRTSISNQIVSDKKSRQMKQFGIYVFQFNQDFEEFGIKAFCTTMVGEVDMTSDDYRGLTVEEACRKRVYSELGPRKLGLPCSAGTMVGFKAFSFYSKKTSHADSDVRALLVKQGYEQLKDKTSGRDTEMLNIGGSYLSDVSDAITSLEGKKPLKVFQPRKLQKQVMDKMTKAFKAGHRTFLLGAICRFGKTATLLHYFTKVNPKANILMITAKCDALNAWQNDYLDFTDRSWQFLTKQDILNYDAQFADKNICVCSFQSAAKDYDDEEGDYEILKDSEEARTLGRELRKVKWDVLIIDECHFGSMTKRSLDFIDKLDIDLKVDVSATPYKKIESGAYTKDNSFIFDLVDEKLICNDSEVAPTYVPCRFYHLDFGSYGMNGKFDKDKDGRKQRRKFIEEQMQIFNMCWKDFLFDWSAYFSSFSSSALLEHFEQLYARCFSKQGKNFAVFVNNIAHGKALASALVHGPFEVINVCGSSYYELAAINRTLDKSEKPVIIISCGRDLTGVTLTKLHGLAIMGTLHSAENYFQFALRGKNWYEGREFCCSVFDLNPKSFIQTSAFGRYVAARADFQQQSLEQAALQSLECFEIFEINDYDNIEELKNLDELIHNAFGLGEENVGGALLEKWMIQWDPLKTALASALHNVDPGASKTIINITEEQTAGRATKKGKKNKQDQNEQTDNKKDIQLAIQKMKVISRIVIQLMGIYEVSHLDEIAKSKELQETFMAWTNAEWSQTFGVVHDYLISRNEAYKWNDLDYAFGKAA